MFPTLRAHSTAPRTAIATDGESHALSYLHLPDVSFLIALKQIPASN